MKNLKEADLDFPALVEDLKIARDHGFYPIAICQLLLESSFCFETEEESIKAGDVLEGELNCVQGWWYGKKEFLDAINEYEDEFGYDVNVYWL